MNAIINDTVLLKAKQKQIKKADLGEQTHFYIPSTSLSLLGPPTATPLSLKLSYENLIRVLI